MENSIILPIDEVNSVRQHLDSKQLGELFQALVAFASSEDPGEMEPAVSLAYYFLKDRVQIKSETCEAARHSTVSKSNMARANELFEKLWKLYPNKKGKAKISDARKRTLLTIGEDQMTRAIQRYIREHEAKQKNGEFVPCWQNGSTFFNSGYVDYLDENYSDTSQKTSHPPVFRSAFPNYEQQSNTDWNDVFFQAMLLQENSVIQAASAEMPLV